MTTIGTNFYVTQKPCKCCGRGTGRWHYGKSFRTLRAYRHGDGPYGASIKSFKDWLLILTRKEIAVVDEYGQLQNKKEFVDRWRERGRRAMSYEQQQAGGYIKDDQGFILCSREFF